MNSAELKAWRDCHGLTNAQAAEKLGLTLTGFLNQLYDRRPVSRQTERLTQALTLLWLTLATLVLATKPRKPQKTR